jgi:hypothetical protein
MQPSESAVAICKIMVGLRVQPEESSARNDVQSAFLIAVAWAAVADIREDSSVRAELESKGGIKINGAM